MRVIHVFDLRLTSHVEARGTSKGGERQKERETHCSNFREKNEFDWFEWKSQSTVDS